jgi:hypothetical protein
VSRASCKKQRTTKPATIRRCAPSLICTEKMLLPPHSPFLGPNAGLMSVHVDDIDTRSYLEEIRPNAPSPDLRPDVMSLRTEALLREYETRAASLVPKVFVAYLGIIGVMALAPAVALATLARSPSTAKKVSVYFSPRRYFRSKQRMRVLARQTRRRWRVSAGFASLSIGCALAEVSVR